MQAKDIDPCITKRFPENYEAEIDRITIIDRFHSPGPRTIKVIEIITPDGKKRVYRLNRTVKGGYLFA